MVILWDYSGNTTMIIFCFLAGRILAMRWYYSGDILGILWYGITLVLLWDYSGTTLENTMVVIWEKSGSILREVW